MTNILFVTSSGIEDRPFGGAKGSQRNYTMLKRYGHVTVFNVSKKSTLSSIFSIIERNCPPLRNKHIKKFKNAIKSGHIELVVFDMSIYGKLCLSAKKIGIKTLVFYANCEYDYVNVQFCNQESLKKKLYAKAVYKNEKIVSESADYLVALSNRDADRVEALYGRRPQFIIPIALKDTFKKRCVSNNERYCLLFGAKGPANIEGYSWFIKNVSPYLKCKTMIAGNGFDEYSMVWTSETVIVKGYVDNLEELYTNAICVAIPLFSGAGMKIKTIEALMFGKYIFATDEAFSGFEINYEDVGARCNSDKEFIFNINKLCQNNNDFFNENSRNIYNKNYSYAISEQMFDVLMKYIERD